MARVSLVAVFRDGKLLLGKRRDTGKWTLPGGHAEDGESAEECARREVREETSLTVKKLVLKDERKLGRTTITTFEAHPEDASKPTPDDDPDNECLFWRWVDVSDGVPKDIAENCAGPDDSDKNVLLDLFGMKKSERLYEEPLGKMQLLGGFPKLGIEDRRETPIIETDAERRMKVAQIDANAYQRLHNSPRRRWELEGISPHAYAYKYSRGRGAALVDRALGAVSSTGYQVQPDQRVNASFVHGNELRRQHFPYMLTTSKSDLGTKAHEDFHQMMERVKDRWGEQARNNLAWNLWHSVQDKPHAEAFAHYANARLQNTNDPIAPEEHVAMLISYLNDKGERHHYHYHHQHSGEQVREIGNGIKDTFRKVQAAAQVADESWLKGKKFQPKLTANLRPPPPEARPQPAPPPTVSKPRPKKPQPVAPNQLSLFKAACSFTYEALAKAEDDEVDRLLLHPSVAERKMALKLSGVRSKHLVRALHDDDAEVQREALRHRAVDHDTLLALMQMPAREHLQLLALQHPQLHRDHLEALYHNHKDNPDSGDVIHAISHHPDLDAKLIEQMVEDGHGQGVVENLNTPAHVLERLIEAHAADPDDPGKRALARRAVQHPSAPKHLVEQAFKEAPLDVKLAVARGPHLPAALAQDALQRGLLPGSEGEALLRQAIVQHPDATQQHLQTAAKDRSAVVRAHAQRRLGVFKHSRAVGEWLAKAVLPADLQHLARVTSDEARSTVDHGPDLEAHPPQHQPDVQAYRGHVLDSAEERGRQSHKLAGVAQKALYVLPSAHPTHSGAKFMLKPYHELGDGYGRLPIKGWAEMTNQALYHAAGIGDLHQRVHVSEHNMGPGHEKEPALVVRMEPGFYAGYHSDFGRDNPVPPETAHSLRQLSLMDFLSHNDDRHGYNVMFGDQRHWNPGTKDVEGAIKPLAIDHTLSFQYSPLVPEASSPVDFASAFEGYGMDLNDTEGWKKAFDWWHQASPQVRREMYRRLEQIRDPGVRAHVRHNFDTRASFLDQHADMAAQGRLPADWYNHTVRSGPPEGFSWPPKAAIPKGVA